MAILRPAILLSAIILFAGTGSQVVFGDIHAPVRMSVIVAHPSATAEAGESSELVESFLGLMGNLRQGQEFTFINAAVPGQVLGPARAGESEFRVFRDDVVSSLTTAEGGLRTVLAGAIAESYNLLDSSAAAPGSTVYVIGGEAAGANLFAWAASSGTVADLLRGKRMGCHRAIAPLGHRGDARLPSSGFRTLRRRIVRAVRARRAGPPYRENLA